MEHIYRGGVHNFIWPENNIGVIVSRITEAKGVPTGELFIRDLSNPEKPGHIHLARLNMTSTTAKNQLIKKLELRTNEMDWASAIELIAEHVTWKLRQGEPITTVGDRPFAAVARYRVYPIVPEQRVAVIYGEGGTLKSTLALVMGISVQTGWDPLGFKPVQGNVLLLDWETYDEDVNDKILALAHGMNFVDVPVINYRYCCRSLLEDWSEICEQVAEMAIEFLIVDSAVAACGGDAQSEGPPTQMLNRLRELKLSTLLISHSAKSDKDKRTPFGSAFWEIRPRNTWSVHKAQQEGEEICNVVLKHQKTNVSKKMKPLGYQAEFRDDGMWLNIKKVDPIDIPDLESELPAGQRIWNCLTGGKLTPKNLASRLGLAENIVRARLHDMQKAGKVLRFEDGKWGILSDESI